MIILTKILSWKNCGTSLFRLFTSFIPIIKKIKQKTAIKSIKHCLTFSLCNQSKLSYFLKSFWIIHQNLPNLARNVFQSTRSLQTCIFMLFYKNLRVHLSLYFRRGLELSMMPLQLKINNFLPEGRPNWIISNHFMRS